MTSSTKSSSNPYQINIDVPSSPTKSNISFFVDRSRISKKYKAPNGFILYRIEISKKLTEHHITKMAEVSRVASRYWRNERKSIKNNYENAAKNMVKEV